MVDDMASLSFRNYQASDAKNLVVVFQDAIRGTGASAYDAQQVAIWSALRDVEAFEQLLNQGLAIVAVENETIAAFGQLHPLDYVAFLYTATPFARQGCATGIYQQLEAHAIAQGVPSLHTHASRIAKHFFLKMGFSVLAAEQVERQGIWFERFHMQKQLFPDSISHPTA